MTSTRTARTAHVRPRRTAVRAVAVLLAVVVAALGLLAATPSPAMAHASLIETTPFDGQELTAPPEQVTLTFNEDINAPTGGLRVYDGDGERVDAGIQRDLTTDTVAVEITEPLDEGAFVATYRVVSEDGHVIRGAFVFTVGAGQAIDDDTLAALFAGGGDTVLSIGAGLGRAATYLGVLLLAGAALWLVVVARSEEDRDEARTWARRSAWLAVAATLVAVPLQAMLSSGLGLGALTNTTLLGETLGGPVGLAAGLRLVALAGALVLLRGAGTPTRSSLALGAGSLALLSFVVDGHTRTVDPAWVMVVGDVAHLAAGAAWLGGLVLLVLALRRRHVADDPVGAATVVARFSAVATTSIVVVTLAGTAMSWANVRQLRALTSTDYGWTLLAKVVLVALIGLVGLYNNRRLVPLVRRLVPVPAGGSSDTVPDTQDAGRSETAAPSTATDTPDRHATAAWTRLRSTARFEVVGVVIVLALTAFLVNLRPAAEEAGITGAFDTYVDVTQDLAVNMVVDPNRAGENEVHLYVFDETGRPLQADDLEGLTVELALPERDLGPIVRTPYVAGPGHWQLDGSDLAVPGAWEVTVVLDLDRLTREQVTIPVVVNA